MARWTPTLRDALSYVLGVVLLGVYVFHPELREPALLGVIVALLGLPQAMRADRNGRGSGLDGASPKDDSGGSHQRAADDR